MPDPIRDALEKAAQIADSARNNEAVLDSYRKLVLAAIITANTLGRDINQDIAATLGSYPQYAPAAPKVGAAAAHDQDILRI